MLAAAVVASTSIGAPVSAAGVAEGAGAVGCKRYRCLISFGGVYEFPSSSILAIVAFTAMKTFSFRDG